MRPHLCPCKCCSTSTDLITVYCAGKATAEELMKRQKVEEKLELLQRENTMLLLQLKSEQLKSEQLRSEQLRSERNKARKETRRKFFIGLIFNPSFWEFSDLFYTKLKVGIIHKICAMVPAKLVT